MSENKKIAIIGLGYVGLPLAVAFASKYNVTGFDINQKRVAELKKGIDDTLEVEEDLLKSVLVEDYNKIGLSLTHRLDDIKDAQIFIVTVPTPIDKHKIPDLTPLYKASESVGRVLKKGDIVIYESTVYPGATEEDCVPILEKTSGLRFNRDFFAGYSPERINPGDKERTVTKILKVTSGSTPEIADEIDRLYKSVITAGTYKASNIKVAEAAKVIENAQRDINIAFVNELSKIFRLMDIDTVEVLEAAGTKWNFLPFRPGLVGGHCIGIDPYYLAHKAKEYDYNPEIILAGRRLNDSMGQFVAQETVKMMLKKNIEVKNANVLVLGITFKENCPDIRNSRAIDVVRELQDYQLNVDVYDPWAAPEEVKEEYGLDLISDIQNTDVKYDAVLAVVAHNEFKNLDLNKYTKENALIYDVKAIYPKEKSDLRL
jgi:UDP-N-acetyl-D-galactosamine dehydrogenase